MTVCRVLSISGSKLIIKLIFFFIQIYFKVFDVIDLLSYKSTESVFGDQRKYL